MITIPNKESIQFEVSVDMETIICYKCAVPFAIPKRLKRHFQDSQEPFYCPNGHEQAYTESTETRLKRQLEKQKEQEDLKIKELQKEAEVWRDHWQKSVEEKKKIARKLKATEKKLATGTCPCCDKTFKNVKQHMETEHPDFVKANLPDPL